MLIDEHSREGLIKSEDHLVHNGKIRCFVCLKDTILDENVTDESDYKIVLKNKTRSINLKTKNNKIQKISNSEENKGSHANHNLQIHLTELISPCLCNKSVHMICLKKYCLFNLSFQCQKCQLTYGIEFSENLKRPSKCSTIHFILVTIFLIIYHSGLNIIAVLLLIDYFNFKAKNHFWCYLLGIAIFSTNLIMTFLSIKKMINLTGKKCKHLKILNKKDCSDEDRKIDSNKGEDIYNYFLTHHNCDSKLALVETKMNNIIFLETVIRDESKISQFINKNNNNNYNIKLFTLPNDKSPDGNNAGSYPLIKSDRKNANLRKQRSYNMQNSIKPSIEKNSPHLLPKSKTKTNNINTNTINVSPSDAFTNKTNLAFIRGTPNKLQEIIEDPCEVNSPIKNIHRTNQQSNKIVDEKSRNNTIKKLKSKNQSENIVLQLKENKSNDSLVVEKSDLNKFKLNDVDRKTIMDKNE